MPLRMTLGALGLASMVGGASGAAFAQEAEQPIRVTYRASEGCPDEGSFFARVRARAVKARLAQSGPEARRARAFDVEIDAGPPASGRVTVGDSDHPDGMRRVEAETCAEVADALALVIALAIEPRAPTQATALPPIDEGSPLPRAESPIALSAAGDAVSPDTGRDPAPAAGGTAGEARARPAPARPNEQGSRGVAMQASRSTSPRHAGRRHRRLRGLLSDSGGAGRHTTRSGGLAPGRPGHPGRSPCSCSSKSRS